MKALLAGLLLVSILIIVLPNPGHAASPCSRSVCSVTFQRTITTNPWGVTFINDIVTLNSTRAVSELTLGIPGNVSNSLRAATATSGSAPLQVSLSSTTVPSGPSSGQKYTSLDIGFAAQQTKYSFNLTTIYFGLVAYHSSPAGFSFSVNPFPLADGTYNVTSATVTLKTGDWPSPKIPSPVNATVTGGSFSAQATLPYTFFNTTIWQIPFSTTGTTQNILSVAAGRVIQIAPSGTVQTTDQYNITNLGPTLSSIAFKVPKGVSGISESYVLGLQIDQPSTAPTPTSNPDGSSTVTFTPSFGSLAFNQSVKVKISYMLSPSTYISTGSLGTYTLNFAMFNNVQFYEPTLQTKIVTPMGFRLNSLTGQVPQNSQGQIVLQASTVTPMSGLGFSMTYQLDPFWASLSPLSWIGLVELAVAASVIAVWKGPGAAATSLGAPAQLITKFVDLYDEKSSLRLESDKMEDDLARGALNKYDYKQRRRMMDRRLAEIDRALAPVKEQLASAAGRYQDMIKRIERAEAELQVIRTTSADLKNQYRTGKISRDLYDSLSADLARRKERTQQTIDTIIINLREEIR